MPNPIFRLNAMTLAAQILTLGTTRAGGVVRAALYSHDPLLYWNWCRSDIEMSRFLRQYIGGGTRFPFELLRKSCAECQADQPIRVVISDHDFDANYSLHPENREIFIAAANQSNPLILMLHQPAPAQVQLYRTLGASVIVLDDLANFPRMATELTASLFPAFARSPSRTKKMPLTLSGFSR